jgi:NAD(P)-dependent dehydrogenase (short-subunit alcohol dehydrogenase family)
MSSPMPADPKTALIVGVGAGLGSALARKFASEGYDLALAARNADRLAPLVAELEKTGVRAKAFATDATNEAAMAALFAEAEKALGPVAVAVHNVNGRVVKDLLDLSVAEFEQQWRAICLGGFLTGREAARHMMPRGKGTIVYIGGRGGRRGLAKFTAFAMAKAGVRSVAESLARELAPAGIHVAHIAVEATIGGERARQANPEQAAKDAFVDPAALAEVVYQTHIQPRNCWTFEIDLRSWSEPFI